MQNPHSSQAVFSSPREKAISAGLFDRAFPGRNGQHDMHKWE
jgi:hypothetical protein